MALLPNKAIKRRFTNIKINYLMRSKSSKALQQNRMIRNISEPKSLLIKSYYKDLISQYEWNITRLNIFEILIWRGTIAVDQSSKNICYSRLAYRPKSSQKWMAMTVWRPSSLTKIKQYFIRCKLVKTKLNSREGCTIRSVNMKTDVFAVKYILYADIFLLHFIFHQAETT